MAEHPPAPGEEEVALAGLLDSLANPTRLALLRQLRFPRTLGEVRVRAEQSRDGLNPERPMSRQAVRTHLDRLLEAGFARAREARRGAVVTEEYLVNHQRLFGLAEELRRLAELRPSDHAWDAATVSLEARGEAIGADGARLVLVHGIGEGRAFRLDGPSPDGWLVGRRWGLPVCLDYDPFVSQEHARVLREGDAFLVEDLPSSRNGVTLNWTALPKGGRAALREGDVVGVGRSLLLFRA